MNLMWEPLATLITWQDAGVASAWLVTLLLLASGLIGCLIPALPGHLLILIGAISHRLMLGPDGSGLAWWSFLVLVALMAISQTVEMLSGAMGARWFGGTRWGALGALAGSLIGLLFLPFGLVLGPLIGAIAGEMIFAKQQPGPAAASGVGSVIGALAGLGMKIAIGLLMVAWFFADVFWIG